MNDLVPEITEDMEIIGPGRMLAEAREKLGLSQEDVAKRLNFRMALVQGIETEEFDKSLPATYNRGYLRNYAKLVHLSVEDVLASYEALNVAERQEAEMQSFSKNTEKQAEHSRIMWISYLVLATLIGLTVLWWLQSEKLNEPVMQQSTAANTASDVTVIKVNNVDDEKLKESNTDNGVSSTDSITNAPKAQAISSVVTSNDVTQAENSLSLSPNTNEVAESELESSTTKTPEALINNENSVLSESETAALPDLATPVILSQAIFTFEGDCWVNIYDATGERIAWGIKKAGYVMTIEGQAPLSITLGKPELVNIKFQGETLDMTQFRQGQIAKFALPIAP